MVEVTTQMIVLAVVVFLACLVGAHLQGRKIGRREQEEFFNADERDGLHQRLEALKQACGEARRDAAKAKETAIAEGRQATQQISDADQRELTLSADLANARRRIDFFWMYPCKVSVGGDNGPQIRFRQEPQDRDEFDAALTTILKKEDPDE